MARPTDTLARKDAAAPAGSRGWPATVVLAAGALVLLLAYLADPVLGGHRFPIGPDGPVYTWWARYGEHAGLAAIPGGRPGVPALTLFLRSILGTDTIGAVALLGPVLAAACGLAAAGLLDALLGPSHVRAATAILLTGTFAAYLAGGWLGNLAQATMFLAAVAALGLGLRAWRAVWAGAALLVAGAITHRLFLALGMLVLALTIALLFPEASRRVRAGTRLRDTMAGRVAAGSGAAVAVGAAALLGTAGASSLPGDTSQDAFLRRAGLRDLLMGRYRERLGGDLRRAAVPVASGSALAAAGLASLRGGGERGFLARLCLAWAAVTVGGMALLAQTGSGPANRMLVFAFFLPLAAAIGVGTALRSPRMVVGGAAVGAALAFAAVAMLGWSRQAPAFDREDVAAARAIGDAVDRTPGAVVVLVDTDELAAGYHVTRITNILRVGIPAPRIADVRFAVGRPGRLLQGEPTVSGDREHDALSRHYLEETGPLLEKATVLVPARFNPDGYAEATGLGAEVAPGVMAIEPRGGRGPVAPSAPPPVGPSEEGDPGVHPAALPFLCVAALILFAVLGAGWARWGFPGTGAGTVAGLAPGMGMALAVTVVFVGDRLGIPAGSLASSVITVAVGAAGYVAARAGRASS